jgi:hypothetical protein
MAGMNCTGEAPATGNKRLVGAAERTGGPVVLQDVVEREDIADFRLQLELGVDTLGNDHHMIGHSGA